MKRAGSYLFCLGVLLSFTAYGQSGTSPLSSLKFIGQYEIPFNTSFRNTVVGGISGIDFDEKQNRYYLISDDRSDKNNARFYTASISISEKGIDSVRLLDVITLRQPNGTPYPNSNTNPWLTPDPEAIRYYQPGNALAWVTEGERKLGEDTVLINPGIQMIDTQGRYKSSFKIPPNLHMQATGLGPRQNGTLEGLSFSEDFTALYTILEEPLCQDGPRADLKETDSFVRIYKFDVRSGTNTAQYAYKLEKIPHAPITPNGFKVNGVSEILYAGSNHLLVIERSSSAGRPSFAIKVFLADISRAENIINCPSLIQSPPNPPAAKKLLLNLDDLDIYIDNFEGVTFGPTLSNGHKTLIFVADNNFKSSERNQFLLFEVIP